MIDHPPAARVPSGWQSLVDALTAICESAGHAGFAHDAASSVVATALIDRARAVLAGLPLPDLRSASGWQELLHKIKTHWDGQFVGDYCPLCRAPETESDHHDGCLYAEVSRAIAIARLPLPAPPGATTKPELRAIDVLRELNDSLPQVDNGHCAICRIGYRTYDTRGRALNNCDNDECISHLITAVLKAPALTGIRPAICDPEHYPEDSKYVASPGAEEPAPPRQIEEDFATLLDVRANQTHPHSVQKVAAFLRLYAARIRQNERWDVPETMANAYESAARTLDEHIVSFLQTESQR